MLDNDLWMEETHSGNSLTALLSQLQLTLMHPERPKLHRGLAFLSAVGLRESKTEVLAFPEASVYYGTILE